MAHERVTAALLRGMAPGKPVTIKTDDPGVIESGKSYTYKMQRLLRCRFTCATDYDAGLLTITKHQAE